MKKIACFLFCFVGVSVALPSPVDISKVNEGVNAERYLDLAVEENDVSERYTAATDIDYHLFTRLNPSLSQPLLMYNADFIAQSNFNVDLRTIILIHGSAESVTADSNTVLIPAFLEAEDVNVIVVDWSRGAGSVNIRELVENTIESGRAVADFINWLNSEFKYSPAQYHIVGHGYGGHMAGIVGRNVVGDVAYITGLDPSNFGWLNHAERFRPNDGQYTEVIHTNYEFYGYMADLAQVDFYPNGGRFSRHANLNDIIRRALATINVPAILEPNGLARDDGKKPDGMSLIPWSHGRPLVWDATCVDTLAASHLPITSRGAGAAAAVAESNKRRKYICLGDGYIFLPFGVETLGSWGPEAKLLFKEISKRLIDKTNDKRAGAYLGQRLSIAIQRGTDMRGCITNECDHARSYFYFAESIVSGGFTGRRCLNYIAAMASNCNTSRVRLPMGGLTPKTGSQGVFYLFTNIISPFSRG